MSFGLFHLEAVARSVRQRLDIGVALTFYTAALRRVAPWKIRDTRMKSRLTSLFAAASLVVLHAPVAFAQEKTEGKVVATKLTACDFNKKVGGCAGTFKMERKGGDKTEELTFNVRPGTPITRGTETVYLPALRGKTVVVTHIQEKNELIAKAVEVK